MFLLSRSYNRHNSMRLREAILRPPAMQLDMGHPLVLATIMVDMTTMR